MIIYYHVAVVLVWLNTVVKQICVEKSQPKSVEKNHPFFSMWRNGQLSRNLLVKHIPFEIA
jgi:pyrroloquinoline quinone (PQQ) biosynthesis protein C